MCGRLACSLSPDDIQKACTYTDKNGKDKESKWIENTGYTYKPFYNGPPTTTIPVLLYKSHFPETEDATFPDYCIAAMKWGFSAPYVSTHTFLHTHNARIETVTKSHMYKPSLMSGGRCVIVAEGFYEWQTTKGESNKQPYFIYQSPYETDPDFKSDLKSKYLMKMAGLFTCSRVDGDKKYSCTIFTTESDSSLSWLHHRMPVILNTQSEIYDWLHYKTVSYTNALDVIKKGFQEKSDRQFALKYYMVDKTFVNKSTCNEAKCMERISLKRPNTLDGWLTQNKKK